MTRIEIKYVENRIKIATLMRFILLWRNVIPPLWDPHSSSSNLTCIFTLPTYVRKFLVVEENWDLRLVTFTDRQTDRQTDRHIHYTRKVLSRNWWR